MSYEEIKSIIEEDYSNIIQARVNKGGRAPKPFYDDFVKALAELHTAISPFITSKEQFILHIEYIKDNVSPGVYSAILTYCKDRLNLNIR